MKFVIEFEDKADGGVWLTVPDQEITVEEYWKVKAAMRVWQSAVEEGIKGLESWHKIKFERAVG